MTEQTSTALEQRTIQNVPVPAAIGELGIRVAVDEGTGNRLILIPSSVRERVNVIDPVTSLVQADPNWTPRISVVQLNPDDRNGPHFYKQAGNKLAPTKQALEVLSKAAGILSTRTQRVPKAELDEGEIGYSATVTIRRSDGTVETVQRDKVWVNDAERAEIEQAVTDAKAYEGNQRTDKPKFDLPGTPTWKAEVEKRWLKELKDRSAKTESKAVLRAIRAALQIPHTFTPQDAAKPFLVIGFNFTPDEETARATLPAAIAALYGGTPGPVERINLDTGEITAGVASPTDTASADDGAAPSGASQQAAAAVSPAAVAVPGDDDEPEPGPATTLTDELAEAARIAGTAEAVGNYKSMTIQQVHMLGDEGAEWFSYVLRHPAKYDDAFYAAVETFVQGLLPELYAVHTEWLAAREAA